MAKASGSTRLVKPFPVSSKTLEAIFNNELQTVQANMKNSYIYNENNSFYIEDAR